MYARIAFFILAATLGGVVHAAPAADRRVDPAAARYAQREDVRAFAAEVAAESGLPTRDVMRWLGAAKFQPKIVVAMDRPLLEPPKWYRYAPPFLNAERVEGGLEFWRANADTLSRAQARFGVPRRDHRRHHRGRNVVRPQHRRPSRDRRAGHAGLRLSTPRDVFPRRAEGVPAARARPGFLAAGGEGIVRRRNGRAAVHAGQLSALRDRLRRRWPRRSVAQSGGRDRQRRQLPGPP